MAITKRFKVSFEVTTVVSSKDEANIFDEIKYACKQLQNGEQDEVIKGFVIASLTKGIDGAVEFVVRKNIRDGVKEMSEDFSGGFSFSPAKVEVIR